MTESVGRSALPPELATLSWLLGTWVGVGVGGYPGSEEFNFGQEVSFGCDGRSFLSYWSRTWRLDTAGNRQEPLDTESGYWRPRPNNQIEVIIAHPSGHAEIWVGAVTVTGMQDAAITGARIEMATDVIARTESATEYNAGHRLYGLVAGELLWAYDIAAYGHPMTSYRSAQLKPDPATPSTGDSDGR